MAAKTKKVILFIVEGPTDEETLSPVLKKTFQREDVRFHVVHGDMTSNWSVSGNNAVKTVYEHIEVERKRYGIEKKDILKVIHLVDIDGAFIPADKVIPSKTGAIQYFDDRIESADPDGVVDRNTRKSQVLYRLCTADAVGKIPYSIYYFSRNLEHVLHDDNRDLTDDEKINYADAFADRYGSDQKGFQAFISSDDFAVPGDFRETWNFIMQGLNSLHRYCNLHLLFQEG
ncbi:MAG: hypothetical protein LBN31_05375 [Hungatella sp.]|jgi:hypothetical protein|nr:hypothetical protein [Hungatella sp.]MDR1770657.1 hypothetical protein [Hungatella sp.]MDR2025558.1 hypothetical protein [Hungatella sp.]